MSDDDARIKEILSDRLRIERAARRAIQDALRRHKLVGDPIVIWRDGRVQWVPADEIELGDEGEPGSTG